MTNEELWSKKADTFEKFYTEKIGRKDPSTVWMNLWEAKMTALISLSSRGEPFSMETFYGVACRALDDISANWQKLPVGSPLQIEDRE